METVPSFTLPDSLLKPTGAEPGIYALALRLEKSCKQEIGRLGSFTFAQGIYLYVGSARGPGGVAARVCRHIKRTADKRLHWHIDWLRSIALPTAVIWTHEKMSSECRWAKTLSTLGVRTPAGFGASDCGCSGHLIRFRLNQDLDFIQAPLHRMDRTKLNMALFGQQQLESLISRRGRCH